jgi:hypothetical protein
MEFTRESEVKVTQVGSLLKLGDLQEESTKKASI